MKKIILPIYNVGLLGNVIDFHGWKFSNNKNVYELYEYTENNIKEGCAEVLNSNVCLEKSCINSICDICDEVQDIVLSLRLLVQSDVKVYLFWIIEDMEITQHKCNISVNNVDELKSDRSIAWIQNSVLNEVHRIIGIVHKQKSDQNLPWNEWHKAYVEKDISKKVKHLKYVWDTLLHVNLQEKTRFYSIRWKAECLHSNPNLSSLCYGLLEDMTKKGKILSVTRKRMKKCYWYKKYDFDTMLFHIINNELMDTTQHIFCAVLYQITEFHCSVRKLYFLHHLLQQESKILVPSSDAMD